MKRTALCKYDYTYTCIVISCYLIGKYNMEDKMNNRHSTENLLMMIWFGTLYIFISRYLKLLKMPFRMPNYETLWVIWVIYEYGKFIS